MSIKPELIRPARALGAVAILVVLITASGCTTQQPSMAAWKHDVETFVATQANGDPVALRDLSWDKTHRGFATLGADSPENSTDVKGVLLAHRMVGGRERFIFLCAVLEKRTTREVRLALLTDDAGKPSWTVGDADERALAAYESYEQRLAKQHDAERSDVPPATGEFPAEEDAFRVSIVAGRVIATHLQSGVQWTVGVPAN